MTHRLLTVVRHLAARLARVLAAGFAAVVRLRAAPQRGQGTVEYVALILLVAGVLAGAVALATKNDKFDLAKTVTEQIDNAIKTVGGGT